MLVVIKCGEKYQVKTITDGTIHGYSSSWKSFDSDMRLRAHKAVFDTHEEALAYINLTKPQRRRFRKRRLILRTKDRPCLDCGINYKEEMTFDHVRGKKCFNVGDGARHGWKALAKEIAKCEVVCRACHNAREYARGVISKLTATMDLSALLLQVAYDVL